METNLIKIREKRGKNIKTNYFEIKNLVNEKLYEKNNYENEEIDYNLNLDYAPYDEFTFNNIIEKQLYYNDNYTKKDLCHIADYYSISKRKKTKDNMILDIVLFEEDSYNVNITNRRKLLWHYLNEIKNDRYLNKFIIFK